MPRGRAQVESQGQLMQTEHPKKGRIMEMAREVQKQRKAFSRAGERVEEATTALADEMNKANLSEFICDEFRVDLVPSKIKVKISIPKAECEESGDGDE